MIEPALEIRSLTVRLPDGAGREYAVREVSLEVRPGKTHCLVGESGSGKSLTALSVLRLLPARFAEPGGQILLAGRDLLKLSRRELRSVRGSQVGMIFQEPMTALNPLLRVGRQIEEVLIAHGSETATRRRERILDGLSEVNLPPETVHRFPHQLSGGQRQRVMIAMALILEPRLLIADEPTTALDVTTQAQTLKLIQRLQARHGAGVLFITHDFGVVAEIADDVSVMKDARIVESGKAEDVLSAPQHPYTRALLEAVPRGRVRAGFVPSDAPVALRVASLTKTFGGARGLLRRKPEVVRALSGVSFEVRQGEIVGVVGESGSGKSTAARCAARLLDADRGEISLAGQDLMTLRGEALRLARRQLQFVFQDPFSSLNPRRRVGHLIAQGPINYGVDRKTAWRQAESLLGTVGIEPSAVHRFPGEFSGGQRQRISLARSLALEPRVLIADEAVSALDVSVQAQILELFRTIRTRLNLAILFITHDLRVAAELCDRIIVMHKGEIVEEGSCRDVLLAPRHDYTQRLIGAIPGRALMSAQGFEEAARPDGPGLGSALAR